MARKLRLEFEHACYHVINRGNYRHDIFAESGARNTFLACLDEAAEKSGWIVHAWCVMSNHYHLAVETPQGNLVDGMKWLQATFATKFNRFRKESGHLFQGRYKSFLVEAGTALGPLCHYIHLNPVRAGIVMSEELGAHPWSSMRWLFRPSERRPWYSPTSFLDCAGDLPDTPAGRRKYGQYLSWLAEDDQERRKLEFDQMSSKWAIGSPEFMESLKDTHREVQIALQRGDRTLVEWRDARCEKLVDALLKCLSKTQVDIDRDPKGEPWKVAIAAEAKRCTNASNPWLANRLNMGSPFRLSRLVSASHEDQGETRRMQSKCAKCKV